MWVTRHYLTLNDLIEAALGEELPEAYLLGDTPDISQGLKQIIIELLGTPSSANPIVATASTEFWCKWFVPYYLDEYVGYYDEGTDNNDVEVYANFMRRYINVYRNTYEKYQAILKAYRQAEVDLLKPILSKSTSRYNDTPQNSGLYEDDSHTSNITASESETDAATPMERIREIHDQYDNVYYEWLKEFHILFVEGGIQDED